MNKTGLRQRMAMMQRERTVRAVTDGVVVPFAPGGPTDIFARLIVQKLSEQFGKQFYIENVGGASGSIGTAQVARATPDAFSIRSWAPRAATRARAAWE